MKKNIIISVLFVAAIAFGSFFVAAEPSVACFDCWSDVYYTDYGGYNDSYYPDYGGYGGYNDSYYFDFYYQPPVYTPPPVYYPPVYTPPVYTPPIYTPPTVPTCSLSASQTNVTSGAPVTISWAASNATTGFISNGIGSVSPSFGTYTVTPLVTTTYVGTFTGQGGSVNCQTTVQVEPQQQPSCTINATPGAINSGDSASLTWSSSNATSVTISNVGSVGTSGSRTVSPNTTTTYVATVTGQGGSATCQTSVSVISQTPSCTLSVSNYSGGNNNTATISWTTYNASSAHIDQGVGSVNTGSGSRTVYPQSGTTVYTMNVSGSGGSATCQTTVQNQQSYQPWCTLSASPSSIGSGQNTTLYWNTSPNATSFHVNPSVGSVNTGSGSRTVYPGSVTTYTGTVYGPNGQSATCQTTIGVYSASNVSLYQQPGDQALAAVSLSQVPYTGFEAGPVVTFVFWLAVVLWSFGIAYIVMGKRGLQFVAERAFGYTPASLNYDVADFSVAPSQAQGTREDEYVNGFTMAPVQSPITVNTPAATTVPEEISVRDVMESRAHKAGILVSPEAIASALGLGKDDEEILRVFSEIINEAVRTLPREDGWILLSSDRFLELAAKHKTVGAPILSENDLKV